MLSLINLINGTTLTFILYSILVMNVNVGIILSEASTIDSYSCLIVLSKNKFLNQKTSLNGMICCFTTKVACEKHCYC